MKRLLSIILVGLMVVMFNACSNDETKVEETAVEDTTNNANKQEDANTEKVSLFVETEESDDLMLSMDCFYPKDAGITLENDEKYPNWVKMNYNSKNISIHTSIFEDTTFDDQKAYAKENEDTYSEFKINGYNCYGYESMGGYWIIVHLEELSDTTDRYISINTEAIDNLKDCAEGIKQYEDADIKKIADSFVYNGTVPMTKEFKEALDSQFGL